MRSIRSLLPSRPEAAGSTDSQRGQILVIFAGGLVTLLILVGLVIDGGMAFLQRRDAQNISDLAAMAGTKVVADHYLAGGRTGAQVDAAIVATADANGCRATDPTPCTWTARYVRPNGSSEQDLGPVDPAGAIPVGAQGVAVHVERLPRTYFLGLIGQSNWTVGTDATALTATLGELPPGQVLPIAADPPGSYQDGEKYVFTAGKDGPGNFGWLAWTGTNDPNTLADSICQPDNPLITFDQWIPGDPGKSNSSNVRACLDYWISTGATVLIPIWGPGCGDPAGAQGQGNSWEYCIVGMAAFQLTWHDQPAIDAIEGIFKGYYGLPTVPAGYGGPPNPSNGVTFIGLVR
jgi:hypothetical protein